MKIIGSVDRDEHRGVHIILADDTGEIIMPEEIFTEEPVRLGMAFSITIDRNREEEERLVLEIEALQQKIRAKTKGSSII